MDVAIEAKGAWPARPVRVLNKSTDKGKCPGGPRAEAFVVASPGGATARWPRCPALAPFQGSQLIALRW